MKEDLAKKRAQPMYIGLIIFTSFPYQKTKQNKIK